MNKDCAICNKVFESKTKAKTCSLECKKLYYRNKNLQWNLQNPEEVLKIKKRAKVKRDISGKTAEYQQKRRNTKEGYVDRALERARSLSPDTDLTREYLFSLLEEDRCNVSGVPFSYAKSGKTSWESPYSPSLDRIDSNLGYYKGNVQVVLTTINLAKNRMSMKDFTEVWKEILTTWKELVHD